MADPPAPTQPCDQCGNAYDARLLRPVSALRPAVAQAMPQVALTPPTLLPREQVADAHPVAEPTICPDCALDAAEILRQQRSDSSLAETFDPPVSFPYYHAAEPHVRPQTRRLPDYPAFDGSGVTIAFLDSGYFPHPDLLLFKQWPGDAPEWSTLTPGQLRELLRDGSQPLATRLVQYVDLTDGQERIGLEQESLWDGAGDSWHGQMTTTVAVGNGLLSGGRYRGLAPGANVLAIKIGRGGGRIPEEDILAGLEWLLRVDGETGQENWARYGVRVLNLSVGGDFVQPWRENAVCQAAEELVQRGVFIAAAAGNSGGAFLLAPATAPNVITVGGVDDENRVLDFARSLGPAYKLYHHNHAPREHEITPSADDETDEPSQPVRELATVCNRSRTRPRTVAHKPEVLGLGEWLPAPILPISSLFREMQALANLQEALEARDLANLATVIEQALSVFNPNHDPQFGFDLRRRHVDAREEADADWLARVARRVRERMNAHKWADAFYQHAEGTSVAVAQISAVAAQMIQTNPILAPQEIRALLLATAQPLPHLPSERTGAGLVQPSLAVAAAAHAPGGRLADFPRSGTLLAGEWKNEIALENISMYNLAESTAWADHAGAESPHRLVYVGCYAPAAQAVDLVGPFNGWSPGTMALNHAEPPTKSPAGWWHAAVVVPRDESLTYAFWVTDGEHPQGRLLVDGEHPRRLDSGFDEFVSVV